MSDKTKKVALETAMTWNGVNYAPGINRMPEEAAKYALNCEFGRAAGETADDDFKPLSIEETVERMRNFDFAPEVVKSIEFHKPELEKMKAGGGQSSPEANTENQKDGLPENFPMRHVFEKLGFTSVEDVQKLSKEKLIALDGIADASAEKALAYGK